MSTVAQLIIELRASTEKLVTDLNKNMSHIRRFQNDLGRFGRTMTTNVTLPLAGIAAAATRVSIEFETAFAGVKKTFNNTGMSAEQTAKSFDELKKTILDMTKIVPATTKEVSKVVEVVQQLGISGKKNIETFGKTIIDFANSTDLSMNDAAFALTKFGAVSGSSEDKIRNLASTVVKLGNTSRATESQILNMAQKMASMGRIAGVTPAGLLAMSASLVAVGVEAEAGGTAFGKLFTKIQTAVEDPKAIKKLQLFAKVANETSASFKTLFKTDADQALLQFIEGLGGLKESGQSVLPTLASLGLTEIRLKNATLATSVASGELARNLKNAREEYAKQDDAERALTQEANRRYETTAAKLKILRTQLEIAAYAFGDILAPRIVEILKLVVALADKLAALPKPIQTAIVDFGIFLAVIGPLAFAIRGVIGGFTLLAQAILLFGKGSKGAKEGIEIFKQAGTVLLAFGRVLGRLVGAFAIANPAVAVAVAALIGSLYLISSLEKEDSDLMRGIAMIPVRIAEILGSGLLGVAKSAFAWGKNIVDSIINGIAESDLAQAVAESLSLLNPVFNIFGKNNLSFWTGHWGNVKDVLSQEFDGIYNEVVAFLDNILQAIASWGKEVLDFVPKIFKEAFSIDRIAAGFGNIGVALDIKPLQKWAYNMLAATRAQNISRDSIRQVGETYKQVGGILNDNVFTQKKVESSVTATTGAINDQKKGFSDLNIEADKTEKELNKIAKAQQKLRDELIETNLDIEEAKTKEAIEAAIESVNEADLSGLLDKLRETHKQATLEGLKDSVEEGGEIAKKLAEEVANARADEEIRVEKDRIGKAIKENREKIFRENADFLRAQLEDVISGTRFNWQEQGKKAIAYIASEFLAAMIEVNLGAAFNLQELFSAVLKDIASELTSVFSKIAVKSFGSDGISSFLGNSLGGLAGPLSNTTAVAGSSAVSGAAGGAGGAFGVDSALSIASNKLPIGIVEKLSAAAAKFGPLAAAAYAAYETIDELKDVGKSREETAEGIATAAGTAIGAYFGGPVGAAIGAKIGEIAGKFLGDAISNNGDKAAQERKLLENAIEDLLHQSEDQGNGLQIFGADGQLQDFGTNLIFGDKGKFNDLDEMGRGWAEKFWADFGDKGAAAFQAVGVGLAKFLGIAQEQGDKLGLILAENFATGSDLYTSLDNIKLFLDNIGISTEQLTAAIFDMAAAGEISWLEFEQFRQQLALIPEEGLAAAGNYQKAMQLFLDSQGRGMSALNALRILAVEGSEAGVTSLEELRLKLIEAGYSVEDVDALFAAFAQRNIKSLEDLKNASDETLGGIVADAESLGIVWKDQEDAIKGATESTGKLDGKVKQLDGSIEQLSSSIRSIPNKDYYITEHRKVVTENVSVAGVAKKGAAIGRFANGGVFHTPQMFRYGSAGSLGVLGEAGPEAILPLKRTRTGELGVISEGGGGMTVINIDASGASPGVEEKIAVMMKQVIDAAASKTLQSISRGRGR